MRLAVGRDYGDVAPLRGVIRGGGAHTLAVGVHTRRVAAPAVTPPTSAPASEGATAIPLSRIRQIIGKRMVESKREAPHFYVTGEFDLEAALKRLQSMSQPRPGLNDLIQYLTVQTLQRVPELNATFEE